MCASVAAFGIGKVTGLLAPIMIVFCFIGALIILIIYIAEIPRDFV